MDNLNCKTQAYARVCKENNEELEKNDCPLKYFVAKRSIFKGCTRRMAKPIEAVLGSLTVYTVKVWIL